MFNQSDPAVYDAIYDSLIPRLNIRELRRHRIALESTISLCAEHARKRLVPTVAIRVQRGIPRCVALQDHPLRYAPHILSIFALYCGGAPLPRLKDFANHVRDEQIRLACDGGDDCPSLACRHALAIRRIRQIVNPDQAKSCCCIRGAQWGQYLI